MGFDLLLKAITELIGEVIRELTLRIPATAGHYLGQFYRLDAIQQKEYDDLGNCILSVRLSEADWRRLMKQSQGELETLVFESSDADYGWNGSFEENEHFSQDGVYMYTLRVRPLVGLIVKDPVEKAGSITMIR